MHPMTSIGWQTMSDEQTEDGYTFNWKTMTVVGDTDYIADLRWNENLGMLEFNDDHNKKWLTVHKSFDKAYDSYMSYIAERILLEEENELDIS